MALKQNTFEGGTHNALITVANSGGGSGDAWDAVTGSLLRYENTRSINGSMSMGVPTPGTATGYAKAVVATKTLAARFYVYLTEASTVDIDFLRFVSDTTTRLSLRVQGTNRLRIRSGDPTGNTWTATNPIPMNQWVRCEVRVKIGNSTSDSELHVAYYAGNDTTPIDSFSSTTQNLGTTNITEVDFGKTSAASYPASYWIDDTAWDDAATAFIGPSVAPVVPPSANAGPDQYVLQGSTVRLAGSSTDPSHAFSWAFQWPSAGAPALSGPTTANPSFTAGPTGSVYTLQLTVSNGDADDSDTVNVAVVPELTGDSTELIWNGTQWV